MKTSPKFVESCLKNIFKSNKVFHSCSLSHTLGRKGEGLESLRKLCKPQKLSCSSVRKVFQLKTVIKTFQNVYTGGITLSTLCMVTFLS